MQLGMCQLRDLNLSDFLGTFFIAVKIGKNRTRVRPRLN